MKAEDLSHDTMFTEFEIDAILSTDSDGWIVELSGLGPFRVYNTTKLDQPPEVGEKLRAYGDGGATRLIRGVIIEGRIYNYMTPKQMHEKRLAATRSEISRLRIYFNKGKAEYMEAVAALPTLFRNRMNRFLTTHPDWGPRFGPYELLACQEAVRITEHLHDRESIAAFLAAIPEEQKLIVPTLDYAIHPTNLLGVACELATVYVTDPDIIPMWHGAMCVSVGCKVYGCAVETNPPPAIPGVEAKP